MRGRDQSSHTTSARGKGRETDRLSGSRTACSLSCSALLLSFVWKSLLRFGGWSEGGRTNLFKHNMPLFWLLYLNRRGGGGGQTRIWHHSCKGIGAAQAHSVTRTEAGRHLQVNALAWLGLGGQIRLKCWSNVSQIWFQTKL